MEHGPDPLDEAAVDAPVPRAFPLATVKVAAACVAGALAIVGMCVGEARHRSERLGNAPIAAGVVLAPQPVAPPVTATPPPTPEPRPTPPSNLGGQGRRSTPQVRAVGLPTVNERLPAEVVGRIVRQNHGRFRLCYDAGLRSRPGLAGRVSVKFVIDRKGVVTQAADSSESTLPDQAVVACIVRSFLELSFPAPEGGVATVVYRMALTVE